MGSPTEEDGRSVHSQLSEHKGVTYLEQVFSGGEKSNMADYDRIDPEVAKYASEKAIHIDEDTNKRLKRMIDKRVLLVMCATYFLQSLDKATLSFSAIMGLQKDTGLVGQEYAWLSTCIYIGILVVEYPMNWTIQRVPVAKFLAFCIICWAAVLCFHALCKDFVSLLVVRTLLGIFESACQPSFLALSSMWYKREEQALTVTYWFMMNGLQQIFGGLLAYAFTNITTGPLKSWQWLFLSYGIISVFWGVFVLWYLPDSPMRAKCFSEEDKKLMVERVRSNQTGLQNRKFRKDQALEALKDPQVYCYGLIQLFTTLPQSGIGAFANIIINSLGFTVLNTQLLAMVLGVLIMAMPLTSAYLVKKHNQTILTMVGFLIPSIIGTIVLMTVANTNLATRAGLLVAYYVVLSFWGASTLALTLITKNVGGQTKKSIAVAVNFFCWAAGNAIGPQVFQSQYAPRYFSAFTVHLICYVCAIATLLYLRYHFKKMNAKKVEYLEGKGKGKDTDYLNSFDDLTDRQNPNFTYIY